MVCPSATQWTVMQCDGYISGAVLKALTAVHFISDGIQVEPKYLLRPPDSSRTINRYALFFLQND